MVTLQIDVDETYKISKEKIENYEKKLGSEKTTSAGNPKNEDIADYNQTDYVNASKSRNTTSSSSGSSGQSSGGNSGKAGTSSSSAMSQHEHSYYLAKYVEATCEASGYRLYQCTGCSDTYKEEIPKTGHNYKAATCTAPQTCTKCGYTVGIKLPHDMYYTNCRYCDYTDFSCVAVATNKFWGNHCFYCLLPGDGHPWGETHDLQEGEASLNVDSSGQCEIFFDGYKLDFQLRMADYYPDSNFDVKFDCYKDGKKLSGSVYYGFNKNYHGFNKNRVQVNINLNTPELQDVAPGLSVVSLDLCTN